MRDVREAAVDANVDGDALPPIDATLRDANRTGCPEAGATTIYAITVGNQLLQFYPPDGTFSTVGTIACPVANGETPFSMAVARDGTAYVVFSDEHLYRVNTATAACTATTYVPRQSNFGLFGMGFATNDVGPTETLYVAGYGRNGGASGLASIDTTTFALSPVGDFSPAIDEAELTGTGDGRLFAFYHKAGGSPPTFIGEIETTTANVVGEKELTNVDQGAGWAFAFWGGDFYVFHAPGGSTVVTRYRPADDTVVDVAMLADDHVVGAGVSTCAPSGGQ